MAEPTDISLPVLPQGPIDEAKLLACIHCGLCLPACPTHILTGAEMPSPRGRLYLMRALLDGTIDSTDRDFQEHELSCLVCRSCETACPSGVEFGHLMEQTRAEIVRSRPRRAPREFIYGRLLPSRRSLNFLQGFLSLAGSVGLVPVVHGIGKLISRSFPRLSAMLRLTPLEIPMPGRRSRLYPATAGNRGRVMLQLSCLGDAFASRVNDAAIRVLRRLGYEVDTLPDVTCCGALAAHAGYKEIAEKLATNAMQVTDSSDGPILSTVAGCGSMMKDYATFFEASADEQRAERFSGRVFDIVEFLHEYHRDELRGMLSITTPMDISYHAPCHLLHGQKVHAAPLALLRMIEGLRVTELPENEICCGSAGSYNIERPDWSEQLLERKMRGIREQRPKALVTANPGCSMQIAKGVREAGLEVRVLHTIELIDLALQSKSVSG